jgi:hypothetical protein
MVVYRSLPVAGEIAASLPYVHENPEALTLIMLMEEWKPLLPDHHMFNLMFLFKERRPGFHLTEFHKIMDIDLRNHGDQRVKDHHLTHARPYRGE